MNNMKAMKYSSDGKQIGEVELPQGVFNEQVSLGAIHDAIKTENANLRQGNHATKTRAFVRGGGKKPWAQKGTGRARQGSTRAPHWVGGGTVHGPQKKDYSVRLPRKVKQKAVVSLLNKKALEQKVKIIEKVDVETYSTKTVVNIFKNMGIEKQGIITLVVSGESKFLKASVRNIATLKFLNSKRMVCRDLLYNNNLVITESALAEIAEQYKGANA
jgi:large subunit ribosomal protein L4